MSRVLRVGGFVPQATLDYPGLQACVLYCQGCAWHCSNCHNPQLITPRCEHEIPWSYIVDYLRRRQGLLQGVVFSGGEATLQGGLVPAMEEVRQLGFKIGLHSAGIKPWTFAWAAKAADWISFEIKALAEDADLITGVSGSGKANWRSLERLLASGVDYECRTTVHWHLLDVERLWKIAERLRDFGVERFAVQVVRSERMPDPTRPWGSAPADVEALWQRLRQSFPHFVVRQG
jgi:anaerobic ribonucleoside-triphosphate reductase activating protein